MRYFVLVLFIAGIIAGITGVTPCAWSQDSQAVREDCNEIIRDLYRSPYYDSYVSARNENALQQLQIRREQLETWSAQFPKGLDEYQKILRLLVEIKQYCIYLDLEQTFDAGKAASVIQEAILKAQQEEAAGRWKQSYESVYQRLILYDPDNPDYRSHTNQLAELIILSKMLEELKPRIHEKYLEQITLEFADSLFGLLERNYIHLIDYQNLADTAFRRCRLLGMVLSNSAVYDGFYVRDNIPLWVEDIETQQSGSNLNRLWDRENYLSVLKQILEKNRQTLCLSDSVLLYLVIQASLQGLDMHTLLLTPWQWQALERQLSNQYGGIGIKLAEDQGAIWIEDIYPQTPAAGSNLSINDKILNVNGKAAAAMDIREVIEEITGPVNTKVDMLVQTADGRRQQTVLFRGLINLPSITGWCRYDKWNWNYMFDPEEQIGYIRIQRFTQTTDSELRTVIGELEQTGLQGLILDLRDNSGGDVESAVSIADYFIEAGLLIRSQPRCGTAKYFMAHPDNINPSYPVVILINQNTASASEILAGCLRDCRQVNAFLIGQHTFGKNRIQAISSACQTEFKIKYSTAVYHFSDGRALMARTSWLKDPIRQYGLSPDLEIALLPHEISGVEDLHRENRLFVWDYDRLSDSDRERFLQKTLQTDSQLAIGLLLLKNYLVKCP